MSTQNPFFSFLTTFPGGTPLNNPDTTQSKGIEMGADGPPGNPLEITDTHNGIIKVLTPPGSVFNPSGRYLHQELNMLDGVHTFGLRTNSSSLPSHQWVLTVGVAGKLTIDSIKGLISGKEIPEGTSTSETLFTMSGKARANATCYLRIDGVRQQGLIAVDGNGGWTHNTATQTPGLHSYAVEGNYESGPVSNPPRTLTVTNSVTGQENFEGESLQDFQLNRPVRLRSGLNITWFIGAGIPNIGPVNTTLYPHWGTKCFGMRGASCCRLQFPGPIRSIVFDYYTRRKITSIEFYDLQGNVIERLSLPDTNLDDQYRYTSPSGILVSRCDVLMLSPLDLGSFLYFDNIRWS